MFIITGRAPNKIRHRYERETIVEAMDLIEQMKRAGYGNIQVYEEKELWTTGRRGCNACINISIYEHSIVATAESDKITVAMMTKALRREFPVHSFVSGFKVRDGGDYLRMDADRWDGDGLAQVEGDLCKGDGE